MKKCPTFDITCLFSSSSPSPFSPSLESSSESSSDSNKGKAPVSNRNKIKNEKRKKKRKKKKGSRKGTLSVARIEFDERRLNRLVRRCVCFKLLVPFSFK